MAVYAIGDIQGCYQAFKTLLAAIGFEAARDELWLTGDLVNRGPDSLAVLRYVRALGERAHCVLGNHDLHLLAVASGARHAGARDTFSAVLAAADAAELLDWLRHRPLLHHDTALGWTMVHAGLAPQWDLATAQHCAWDLERRLRRDDYASLLAMLFGDEPDLWHDGLNGLERLRFTTNCLTRLRYCSADGRLALKHKGAPGTQTEGLVPWFRMPGRVNTDLKILFGHWSTLGALAEDNLLALDGGCVWGGELVAARLDGETVLTTLACEAQQVP